MRLRFRHRLEALARDERGASMIEFALFAPMLALMVMGISDVSMGYSRKLTVEQAAYRTLERVAVGSVQSDYSSLRTEAAAAAGVPVGNVTVTNWLECNGTRQADFNGLCGTGEMIARYVQIDIAASYTPSFSYGPLSRGLGGEDGNVALSASAAVRVQ